MLIVRKVTVQRLVVSQPYTFKDGLTLPVGTTISFVNNEYSLDPDVHQNPHASVLDPKRFIDDKGKLRIHFASTEDTIVWGSGSHACPGRFFAQDAIKLMLVFLLRRYQFKFAPKEGEGEKSAEGGVKEPGTQRPPDMPMNFNIVPNFMAPVLFKINDGAGDDSVVGYM